VVGAGLGADATTPAGADDADADLIHGPVLALPSADRWR
jgi:hypothetical protein